MTARDIVMSAAGNSGDSKTYIEDVFSTYLYTGNGSTQTITNGIDLAGKGGMVWCKLRSTTGNNNIHDTVRGYQYSVFSESTSAQTTSDAGKDLTSFNSNGFSIGPNNYCGINTNGESLVSWTFRKAPKFFDVVTYTGDGVNNRQISHSLGIAPGMVIVKRTSGTENWPVYHRSVSPGGAGNLYLNLTLGLAGAKITDADATTFTVIADTPVNEVGSTYVAYLFAHDETADGLIQCGSFTTDSGGNATVNLGWEPQYIMYKRTDSSTGGDWNIFDTMRGMPDETGTSRLGALGLRANTSQAELTWQQKVTSTGFFVGPGAYAPPFSNSSYIYMAIRRPMKVPTDGTKVFSPNTSADSLGTKITTGFPIDSQLICYRAGSIGTNSNFNDRLRGNSSTTTSSGNILVTSGTAAESTTSNVTRNWDNTGFEISDYYQASSTIYWNFKRAPGFFDVVCYTGTGVYPTSFNHNLGVVPEMMIVKSRSAGTTRWVVYNSYYASSGYTPKNGCCFLNNTGAWASGGFAWGNTAPTDSTFTVGFTDDVNGSGVTYVAYLFASCPGVSKVGSYIGDATNGRVIDCGFTNGARFVLLKKTNDTGYWVVWDTARGIVSGNDPYLFLNTTDAENAFGAGDDIDPHSSGFAINGNGTIGINNTGDTWIYLAIA